MLNNFKSPELFNKEYSIGPEVFKEFMEFTEKAGIKPGKGDLDKSFKTLKLYLKAYIARLIWKEEGYFPIINSNDKTFIKALEVIKEK